MCNTAGPNQRKSRPGKQKHFLLPYFIINVKTHSTAEHSRAEHRERERERGEKKLCLFTSLWFYALELEIYVVRKPLDTKGGEERRREKYLGPIIFLKWPSC